MSDSTNSQARFEVWLETKPQLAATKISFSFPPAQLQRTLIRGRGAGAFPSPYSFPWSAAPKALVSLAIKTEIQHLDSSIDVDSMPIAIIEGRRGSLAASLDYAISKKPNWIMELFSSDKNGRSLVHKFFLRTNPERKLGETVLICFNQKTIDPQNIQIYINGKQETSLEVLQNVMKLLDPPAGELNDSSKDSGTRTMPTEEAPAILEAIRKERYAYFPPGPEGWDAATLAIYQNPGLTAVTSYFYRPALTLCPRTMLEKMQVHGSVLARNKLVYGLLRSGQYTTMEICPERTLLDIIRLKTETEFEFYPHLGTNDIIAYLDHLIDLLDSCPNYQLVLTAANIPLHVATYDFLREGKFERFTSNVNRLQKDHSLDYECVVLHEELSGPADPNHLIKWIMSNVETDKNRNSVREKILNVRALVVSEGPLPPYVE